MFSQELSWIENDNIRETVKEALAQAPSYFYEMAASSSGKYHPTYTLGKGGLVRHTKAAVKIAHDLLSLESMTELREKHGDEIIAALILHDSVKKGTDGANYTTWNHPLFASILFRKVCSEKNLLDEEVMNRISGMINSHMGQWNTDRAGVPLLPKPKTEAEKFVHYCDYLASRKYLTVEL